MPPALSQPIRSVSVAARHEGRFLLVLRAREPARGLHAFPGGRVEPGETAEEAARRELLEETGLSAARLTRHCVMHLPAAGGAGPGYDLEVYVAEAVEGQLIAGDDAKAAGWYTVDEMEAIPITASTLEVARAMAAADAAR